MELATGGMQVLGRIVACIGCIIVLCHAVQHFGIPSRSTPRNVWRSCRTVFAKLWASCIRDEKAPIGALDGLVRDRMIDFRVRQCVNYINKVSQVTAITIVFTVASHELQGAIDDVDGPSFGWNYVIYLCKTLILYCGLLVFVCGLVELTVLRLHIFHACAMLHLATSVIMSEDDPTFFTNLGLRVVLRMAFGIGYLDWWKSCWWNIGLSMVFVWRYHHNVSAFEAPPVSQGVGFGIIEVVTCVLLVAGLYSIEKLLESRLRLQIVTEHQTNASLRLLGFQCDAVLWLTREFVIDGPARQFAVLLLDDARDDLDGHHFDRYIADDGDRERFRNFMATSFSWQDRDTPPAVLHMHMRCATGARISVEVYQVPSIGFQDRQTHLIGLRDNTAREAQWQQNDRLQQEVQRLQDEQPPTAIQRPENIRLRPEDQQRNAVRQLQDDQPHHAGRRQDEEVHREVPRRADEQVHHQGQQQLDEQGRRRTQQPWDEPAHDLIAQQQSQQAHVEMPEQLCELLQRRRAERAERLGFGWPAVQENACAGGFAAPARPIVHRSVSEQSQSGPPSIIPEERTLPRLTSTPGETISNGLSEVYIQVDVFSENLTVSEVTLRYACTERAPGFLSWLATSQVEPFDQWLQANVNCAFHGERQAGLTHDAGRLVLWPKLCPEISADTTQIYFPDTFGTEQSGHAMLRVRGISLLPAPCDFRDDQQMHAVTI